MSLRHWSCRMRCCSTRTNRLPPPPLTQMWTSSFSPVRSRKRDKPPRQFGWRSEPGLQNSSNIPCKQTRRSAYFSPILSISSADSHRLPSSATRTRGVLAPITECRLPVCLGVRTQVRASDVFTDWTLSSCVKITSRFQSSRAVALRAGCSPTASKTRNLFLHEYLVQPNRCSQSNKTYFAFFIHVHASHAPAETPR